MPKQFGKTAKMASGGDVDISSLLSGLGGFGHQLDPLAVRAAMARMTPQQKMEALKLALTNQGAASPAAGAPMASQQAADGPPLTPAAAMPPRASQGFPQSPQIPPALLAQLAKGNPTSLGSMPPANTANPGVDMAAMAQQAAPPPAPLNLPPPRMPQSPQGAIPTPAPVPPAITGSGEDAPLPQPGQGATPPFLPPKGKNKVDWRDFLQKALMSGMGGMAVGATGINPIAGAGLGALAPLLAQLLKKKKKTDSDTEKKAKGGVVQAKKSSKKFGGAKKSTPKRPMPMEPDGDEMMPPGMGMMKKGGCVKTKKMATGGLVSRGMGAARGGSFKSY